MVIHRDVGETFHTCLHFWISEFFDMALKTAE